MAKFANGDIILRMNLAALAANMAMLANLIGIKKAKESLQLMIDRIENLEIEEPKGTGDN